MYGSIKDIKHNLTLFFIDGITFMPSMTLLSATAVVPYFLAQLDATTFQIALAASIALVCTFMAQPFFGYIATHSHIMHKTFGKILLFQRSTFLVFVLCIPLFAGNNAVLISMFLFFWGLFHIFVGSYGVFHTPMILKLLPPGKRGTIRGIGFAIGSFLGLGGALLIPVILGRISFPYNYMLIFSIGLLFLLINATVFIFMRQHEDIVQNNLFNIVQYLNEMISSVRESKPFRAMIFTTIFLVIANSLLPYYTLYAIRIFSATEYHIAALAALAVFSNAFGHIVFGAIADRYGPRATLMITTLLVIFAGAIALITSSLSFLFVAWILANLATICYFLSVSLLIGEVSPATKLPLYVVVQMTITLAFSSVVLLLLAPMLESIGFMLLFATVFACGIASLLINLLFFRKQKAS